MSLEAALNEIRAEVAKLIEEYKQFALAGKWTFSEIVALASRGINGIWYIAVKVGTLHQSLTKDVLETEAKALAIKFYDQVIAPLDIPGIPNLIEGMVDRAIRDTVWVPLVSGFIDYLSKLIYPNQVDGRYVVGSTLPVQFETYACCVKPA